MRRSLVAASAVLLLASATFGGCADNDTCEEFPELCNRGGSGSGGAGTGGNATGGNAGGSTGASGGGGGEACEPACSGDAPLCDATTNTCVACLGHDDCTDASAAQCDSGACVACDDSAQCTEADATLCNAGTCMECSLDDESACTGGNTCDLLTGACVAVGPGSVGNCEACSNDTQCSNGRCIPMEFEGNPHGYYCLAEPSPLCAQPFGVAINKPSISGIAATNYCGIEEDNATCEVVLALAGNWFCTVDGMCSELDGGAEVSVPGSICRQVGLIGDRCTYACGVVSECPSSGPPSTCGTGTQTPPGWCGG